MITIRVRLTKECHISGHDLANAYKKSYDSLTTRDCDAKNVVFMLEHPHFLLEVQRQIELELANDVRVLRFSTAEEDYNTEEKVFWDDAARCAPEKPDSFNIEGATWQEVYATWAAYFADALLAQRRKRFN